MSDLTELAKECGARAQPVESTSRWVCLLCKSGTPGRHFTLDDGVTPCPNGREVIR